MDSRKNLPFKSYGVKKPRVRAHREPCSCSFGTNETQQLREGQLVGRMLLQRLATGATDVKQARYRRGPTRAARHSYAHAQYTACHCVYGRSLALAVQYETMHGVYEFRRGFCTLVLSLTLGAHAQRGLRFVCVSVCLSVTATAFVSTCNQRHLRHYYRLFLDFNSWIFEKPFRSKVMA